MVLVTLSHLVLESFLDNQYIWDQGIQETSENRNAPFSQCIQSGSSCSLRWEGLEERLLSHLLVLQVLSQGNTSLLVSVSGAETGSVLDIWTWRAISVVWLTSAFCSISHDLISYKSSKTLLLSCLSCH